jgi:hypothetical protein
MSAVGLWWLELWISDSVIVKVHEAGERCFRSQRQATLAKLHLAQHAVYIAPGSNFLLGEQTPVDILAGLEFKHLG